jgi:hypothetical protein
MRRALLTGFLLGCTACPPTAPAVGAGRGPLGSEPTHLAGAAHSNAALAPSTAPAGGGDAEATAPDPSDAAPRAQAAPAAGADAEAAQSKAREPAGELVWRLRFVGKDPHPDSRADVHEVTLLVRWGATEKRYLLGRLTGAFLPSAQRLCHAVVAADDVSYPAEPHEVAKIMAQRAGASGYGVRRTTLHTGQIVSIYDGHREDGKLDVEPVRTIPLPNGVLRESIVLIDEKSDEAPFECSSR